MSSGGSLAHHRRKDMIERELEGCDAMKTIADSDASMHEARRQR